MIKVLVTALISILLATFAALPGAGLHCNGTITQIDVGSETIYLDDRTTQLGEINHFVYRESNGVAGLQSGGSNHVVDDPFVPGFSDTCDHEDPDQLII